MVHAKRLPDVNIVEAEYSEIKVSSSPLLKKTALSAQSVTEPNEATAWCSASTQTKHRPWLELHFPQPLDFRMLYVHMGFDGDAEKNKHYVRPKRIRVDVADGKHYYFTLPDVHKTERLLLPERALTQHVKLTVLSTYPAKDRKPGYPCISYFVPDLKGYLEGDYA